MANRAKQELIQPIFSPTKRKRRHRIWMNKLMLSILSLIFPILPVWELLKVIANKIFGKLIGKIILPSQNISEKELREADAILDKKINEINDEHSELKLHFDRFYVRTYSGIKMDTIQLSPQDLSDKYIINFPASNSLYERNMDFYIDQVESTGQNVIAFNHRNVNKSIGRKAGKSRSLVNDGIYQVQRLLDMKIPPENITVTGASLGAANADAVALYFHDLKIPIRTFNRNGFSSLTNVVVGWIRAKINPQYKNKPDPRYYGNRETSLGIFLGALAKPFIALFLFLMKWEINATHAYQNIPETHKEYMCVHIPKEIRKKDPEKFIGDSMVTAYASLHKSLEDDRYRKKMEVQQEIKYHNKINKDHLRSPQPPNWPELYAKTNKHRLRKMIPDEIKAKHDGHQLSPLEVENSYGESGRKFFFLFMKNEKQSYQDVAKRLAKKPDHSYAKFKRMTVM